ncbi:hypothetical protein PR048_008837 [Dryococelus australis]|uniref:Uncharacterized protein n=1 Tax=Dryococelus australis TaxID=614101 RepID=A0ABQ9HY84_9NEOP|nr:hypothetical protein PR048_008837 [Dryococelus australis]
MAVATQSPRVSARHEGRYGQSVGLLASHQGDPGSILGWVTPDFRMWESCRTMPLVCGFSRGSPVSPASPFRRYSTLTSTILIGSQDLDFKNLPYLFTSLTANSTNINHADRNSRSGRLLTSRSSEPMRVTEVSMEQSRNEGTGETGDPREDPTTNGIVRHDSHVRKSGATQPGIKPGSLWWEASNITAQPPPVFYGRGRDLSTASKWEQVVISYGRPDTTRRTTEPQLLLDGERNEEHEI